MDKGTILASVVVVVIVVCINLTQARVVWEKGTQLRKCLLKTGLKASLWTFS